jgi:hypothetical protein
MEKKRCFLKFPKNRSKYQKTICHDDTTPISVKNPFFWIPNPLYAQNFAGNERGALLFVRVNRKARRDKG